MMKSLSSAKAAVSMCATMTALSVACTSAPSENEKPSTTQLSNGTPTTVADDEVNPRLLRRFQPLPAKPEGNAALIDLGRWLYYEKRLSKKGDVSCNTCHALDDYGVDHRRTSTGEDGAVGNRNSPTVYNAAGHFAQFWDGRAADLEEQAKGPILNPKEMAMPDGTAVVAKLTSFPEYRPRFANAFPQSSAPISYENVGKAIAAFERGLVTPGRWDEFLRGKKDALSIEERKGLKTFLNRGCMVCHTGPYLGGSMFERLGVVEPWPNQTDLGRASVTKSASDRMMFKVPSLRNIGKTAPYFHDGSAATLEEAVRLMGRHQLGVELGSDEIGSIITWLESLTSPLPPASYIADPSKRKASPALSK